MAYKNTPPYLQKYIQGSKFIIKGPPARYELQLKRVNLGRKSNKESKLRRFTLGEYDTQHLNKTILLVGATGSGKSTLINALVNYVMGVEFKDKLWFEVISDEQDRPQAESQTSAVSVYDIFGFEGKTVPYSLTIIDTPGFGQTEGIEQDKMILKLLQDLFCIPGEVDMISAVGLVMNSTLNRLDDRTAYIFNSVTSLFGHDMEQNIVVMMTHSDGRNPKNALRALEEANILCARDSNNEPVYFLFNNCQKEMIGDASDEEASRNAFKTSNKGMDKFATFLKTETPQSLKMTVEVMKERIRLTACVQNLRERVAEVEMKQEAIRKNREEVSRFENHRYTSWYEEKISVLSSLREDLDLEKEISDLKKKKEELLNEAFGIIEQLEWMALNIDPVDTYIHLEFLIEKMKAVGDTYKVQILENMRDRMDEKNKSGARYLMGHMYPKFKSLFKI